MDILLRYTHLIPSFTLPTKGCTPESELAEKTGLPCKLLLNLQNVRFQNQRFDGLFSSLSNCKAGILSYYY